MSFTTLTFILFLLVVFTVYWAIPSRRGQNVLLVLASYFFYGWWDWRFCGLMLISSLVDYIVCLYMENGSAVRRKRLLIISIISNLSLLGFFKYYNFFVDSARGFLGALGWSAPFPTLEIILPAGISFYTFQTMSYTIDVYRGHVKICHHILDYLAYVCFFPQLVAGPIERANRFLPQFLEPRRFDEAIATDGCRQILWGFFKKMVIADNLAPLVDSVYAHPDRADGPTLAVATIFFAFQIYCDFSAYSDIAVGLGKLFGFQLMRNFAYPYFSLSVAEFWRRWHISLSTWFRDYVYIPLGGGEGGPLKRARNVMITFTVSGLWHGASWNFVIWGALNGLGILPTVLARRDRERRKASDTPGGERFFPSFVMIARMAFCFAFICLGWIFFRARTLPEAWTILTKIVTLSGPAANASRAHFFGPLSARTMVGIIALFVFIEWVQRRRHHPLAIEKLPRLLRQLIYAAVFWSILLLGTYSSGQFIYFQF
jgi:alginate O-acetyltransferase complex protein AlgI